MPRTITLICSGICLLLTTSLPAQFPLPKHPTLQQVVGYAMREQRAWNHKQLPANSVLFKADPAYTASHAFLNQRNLMNLTAPSLIIRQSYSLYPNYKEALVKEEPYELLQLYLARDRVYYSDRLKSRWLTDPSEGFGSGVLRNLLGDFTPPPTDLYKPRPPR